MLNDLFGHISFLGYDPDLPGSGPVSHSSWTKFARAGQIAQRRTLLYAARDAGDRVRLVPTPQRNNSIVRLAIGHPP